MISICCPTRKRPQNMNRIITSAEQTAPNGGFEFVFYVDSDDQESINFPLLTDHQRIIGDRIVLSEMWNVCARHANGDIFMHCGDDIIFRSPGWVDIVERVYNEAVPDKIALVHGDDGLWGASFGTHCFVSRTWVDALGYLCPPYFSSDWNDTWLNELGNALNRRYYFPDIVTEHMHPVVGKAGWDETHLDRQARGLRDNVDEIYKSPDMVEARKIDYEKLLKVINDNRS